MKRLLVAAVSAIGLIGTASAQAWVGGAYVVSSPGYTVVNPYAPPVFVAPQPVQPMPPTYVVPAPAAPAVVYSAAPPVYMAPAPVYVGPNYGGVLAATALIGGAAALIATSNNRYYGGYRPYHGHYRR